MNTFRRSFLPSSLLLTLLVGLSIAATPRLFASPEEHADQGVALAKTWIAQIDAEHYDESYTFASDVLRDKVPQDRWVDVLKALRKQWGTVLDRQQTSHVFKPNGYEGTSGEFLVITYDTSFKKLSPATEVVVLKWEGGKWRGAGYNAGPKQSDDSAVAPSPSSSTEVHTESHVKPLPK